MRGSSLWLCTSVYPINILGILTPYYDNIHKLILVNFKVFQYYNIIYLYALKCIFLLNYCINISYSKGYYRFGVANKVAFLSFVFQISISKIAN